MEPLPVVEDFDVFEDGEASLLACGEGPSGEEFGFEGALEALHVSVVVAVGATAHAGRAAVLAEELAIAGRGVLDAAVAVMEHAARSSATDERLAQRTVLALRRVAHLEVEGDIAAFDAQVLHLPR